MVDIVFTGGGTAGHVTPNLALIPSLMADGYSVAYIGQANSIEQKLIEKEHIDFYTIKAGKLRRYFDLQNFTDLFRIALGLCQAFFHLLKLKPKLIFSKGGFVSCPVVWSAWLLRIPVIIHESDISPGLANRLSLPFCKKVCFSFPETEKYLPANKGIFTGLPIRDFLKQGNAEKGKALCRFDGSKPIIVLIGGSQGSRALNALLRRHLPVLSKHYDICHLCGAGELDETLSSHKAYAQFEYLNEELADVFAMADLVITRAGATSIFELLSLSKLNLLIPLPLGASRGDQILNAQSFVKQGFSLSVEEQALQEDDSLLSSMIEKSFSHATEMKTHMMNFNKEDARLKILSLIKENIN